MKAVKAMYPMEINFVCKLWKLPLQPLDLHPKVRERGGPEAIQAMGKQHRHCTRTLRFQELKLPLDLLVRVSPMLLVWHLGRCTWLPTSTNQTMRSSTTTLDRCVKDHVPISYLLGMNYCFSFVLVAKMQWNA